MRHYLPYDQLEKEIVSWYFSPTTGEESIFKMNSFLKFGLKHALPTKRTNESNRIDRVLFAPILEEIHFQIIYLYYIIAVSRYRIILFRTLT